MLFMDKLKKTIFALIFVSMFTALSANVIKNDFNGDGVADILWRNGVKNHVWLMDANGSHSYINIGDKNKKYYLAGTGNFNDDNITDILWRDKSTGVNHIWYMNADGSHTYKSIGTKNKKYYIAGIGDLNGDGIDDILWKNGTKNYVWYMQADGTHLYKYIGGKRVGYSVVDIADFSGDGIEDILWVGEGAFHNIWVMNSDGTHIACFNDWFWDTPKSIEHAKQVISRLSGDFNGDGIADVFTHEEQNNIIFYTQSKYDVDHHWDNASIYSHYVYNAPLSLEYKLAASDDFNGDGISDVLWRDNAGNNIIWMMNSDGSYSSVNIGQKDPSYTPSGLVAPSFVNSAAEIRSLAIKDKNISNLDVSNVTNMEYAFYELKTFNQPIGNWDVSNVQYMDYMFYEASSFNQPIGDWDLSSVVYTKYMFYNASSFNQPIGDWDVSNVRTMG